MRKMIIFTGCLLFLLITSAVAQQRESVLMDKRVIGITDLQFAQPSISDLDIFRTLQSVVKVKGTEGLYLMTHYGKREKFFQKENQELIDNPFINDKSRHCSIFSTTTENSVIMGRNWDNENVGSIIINLYYPPKGYSSISFSRSIDLGFGKNIDLEQIRSLEIGSKLLLAPFYAMDGINEHGVAVAVAANEETVIKPTDNRELIFITFLIRKILDQTKNIEEAVNLAENFVPFLLDKNTLVAHLFVVDASGSSVVLEYTQDQWRKTYGDRSWQVISTKPIYNVSDADLREKCWRYQNMSETLENSNGNVDWKAGMKILQDVTQKGTTWSIIYSLPTKELYFSVYQNWDIIYHLKH